MPRFTQWLAFGLLAALVIGCTPATPQASNTPAATNQETQAQNDAATEHFVTPVAGQETFEMRVVTKLLSYPLELIYGPDDYLWMTERTGKRVARVNPVDGAVHVALELPDAYQRANQDGVLGMVLHPELLQGTGNDYVFLSYTYRGDDGERRVKIVRYRYAAESETLVEPLELMSNLSGSGDHNSAKMVIGPDGKLYYSIGDQGRNQFESACLPIQAQLLPTAAEVSAGDWSKYQGKVLRMNLDGSIPDDNPTINGVKSHIFTYGHRNVQGLAISDEGLLYGSEHGPKSDDEINLLEAGKNYGWPNVVGYQDDQGYVYGNWSAAPDCDQLEYSDFAIPESVPVQQESDWSDPNFTPPMLTFGTVPNGYDFKRAECAPNEWMCWPTVAPTGMTLYSERESGMPGWSTSLLVTALKTGSVYRLELSPDGREIVGPPVAYFKTTNRYRDIVVGGDGRTFYVITDSGNWTQGPDGLPTDQLDNPGVILEFHYTGDN